MQRELQRHTTLYDIAPDAVNALDPGIIDLPEGLSTDTITRYLREIGQTPLLRADEEVALAQAIETGKAARDRLEHEPGLSPDERRGAIQAQARGQDARCHLIQANLRLVVSIAKRYMNRGISLLDLIQEGNIGLMRAVEKFEWRKGNRFSTYATWWIRQAVTRSLAEHSRMIRLPVHLGESLGQLKKVTAQLAIALEREPTVNELATAMGLAEDQVRMMLEVSRQTISLHTPASADSDASIGEFLEDDRLPPPDVAAEERLEAQALRVALQTLPDRERIILEMRYGLRDGQRRTLEEVGAVFGITRERARQVENEALRRLRRDAPYLNPD